MPARARTSPDVYQIRISLLETEIWRRVLALPDFSLLKFHQVIQIAMGWSDSHLHEFRVGKNIYGAPDEDDDAFTITRRQDERHVLLREMLPRRGSKASYTYDFGDSWEHEIKLEKLVAYDPATTYPLCVAGEMACPPDDCGGIPGYFELLEAIRDPQHERHAELLECAGDDYDPERFSLEQVNRVFQSKSRKARR
jgi:hypothetical protein